jgi:Fur family ferric uptake transcriptional regulator
MDATTVLQAYGFRRTSLRTKLIETLEHEPFPVRPEALQKQIPEADLVTLYRALEAFTDAGMLERSDFQHGHAHYELRVDRPHHHHAVCESCGKIEDIPAYDTPQLTASALRDARGFSSIDRHSLEFYGQCRACASEKK